MAGHPRMRILLIEDEADLLASLAKALREDGYAVDTAADGEDGRFKAQSWDYDAVVLDVMLPRLEAANETYHLAQRGHRAALRGHRPGGQECGLKSALQQPVPNTSSGISSETSKTSWRRRPNE